MRESKNGGQGRNRTADTGIFNPLLYRLSYLASEKRHIKAGLGFRVKVFIELLSYLARTRPIGRVEC